jgi:PAS domain S-box-containing protein
VFVTSTEALEPASIIDAAADAIVAVDALGLIRRVNRATALIFGYSANELVGRPVDELCAGDPLEPSAEPIYTRGRRKDGSIFPIEVTFSAGERVRVAVIRDVTERCLIERRMLQCARDVQADIGRELEERLGQRLTGIAFLANGLQNRVSPPDVETAAHIVELINQAIRSTREMANRLCPINLSELGLSRALRELAKDCTEILEVPCALECGDFEDPEDPIVRTQLFLIAREAITHAIRHGHASRIDISWWPDETCATLRIRDDGTGMNDASIERRGLGVRGIYYRARMIGASLTISPRDGGGTVVTCRWNEDEDWIRGEHGGRDQSKTSFDRR